MSVWSGIKKVAKYHPLVYVGGKLIDEATKPYRDAANKQKAGAAKAAGDLRGLGTKMGSFYDERQADYGSNMRNVFDPADRAIGALGASTGQGTQSRDFNQKIVGRGSPQPASVQLYHQKQDYGGPQQVRNFAGAYSAPTNTKEAYDNRKVMGYGDGGLGFRIQQRQLAQPSEFDRYVKGRLGTGKGGPTFLEDTMRGLGGANASERTDEARKSFAMGGGDSGAMLGRILSGDTNSGRLLDKTDNPYETVALGDTYDWTKGQTEAPSYSEDFYTSSLTGTNPAYELLKKDFVKDTQRSTAARGGFVSGKAMDVEGRGLARLAGEEYQRRGALAAQADQSKLGRLGARQTSASAYDSGVLGTKNYLSGLTLGIDKMAADLSMSRDQLVATLANQGDISQQQARQLMVEGAKAIDVGETTRRGQDDSLARGQADIAVTEGANLDSLIGKKADADFRAGDAIDRLGVTTDQTIQAGQRLGFEAATGASKEQSGNDDYLRGLAKDADTGQDAQDRTGLAASTAASEEAHRAYQEMDTLAGRALDVGKAKAAVKEAYDMATGGALSSAELSAIQTELTASGIDAQTLKAITDTIIGIARVGAEGYKASQTGGRA